MESVSHLFVECRFTVRIWICIQQWLGIPEIQPNNWGGLTAEHWWRTMMSSNMPNRKAVASLMLLATWEIWNERNARVFRSKHMPPLVLLDKIKREARLWVTAGAKCLGNILPGE
jgi:hypothetical protein